MFHFPSGVKGAVDLRGGSPGVLEHPWGRYDAICFAGGSLYGLEAATGVAAELLAQRDYAVPFITVASVGAAIIYDFARKNTIYPDKSLGRAALRAAKNGSFRLGACGAGASATVGKGLRFAYRESAGQGGAFRQLSKTKIAVFTVVNVVGAIVNLEGNVVRGNLDPRSGQHLDHLVEVERKLTKNEPKKHQNGNATITLLATNQKFNAESLHQIGRQVHSPMSPVIRPFHTMKDGDSFFTVTTNEVENAALDSINPGHDWFGACSGCSVKFLHGAWCKVRLGTARCGKQIGAQVGGRQTCSSFSKSALLIFLTRHSQRGGFDRSKLE